MVRLACSITDEHWKTVTFDVRAAVAKYALKVGFKKQETGNYLILCNTLRLFGFRFRPHAAEIGWVSAGCRQTAASPARDRTCISLGRRQNTGPGIPPWLVLF